MGSSEQTSASIEADAFFARFINAPAAVIAAVVAERDGNLRAVVDESRAFGYWDRKIAARTARRTRRNTAERTRQIADATRFNHPLEAARRPAPEATSALPSPRVVRIDEQQRRETARWWGGFRSEPHRNFIAGQVQREVRDAKVQQRRNALHARMAGERWRAEQQAFERAQWRAVLARQAERRRLRVANRWAAISEQRALEIATTALAKTTPPQGRK